MTAQKNIIEPFTRKGMKYLLQRVLAATHRSIQVSLTDSKSKDKNGFVNVMWDKAAAMSFITNKKAWEEKLKRMCVELSIAKVGAKSEKIASEKMRATSH